MRKNVASVELCGVELFVIRWDIFFRLPKGHDGSDPPRALAFSFSLSINCFLPICLHYSFFGNWGAVRKRMSTFRIRAMYAKLRRRRGGVGGLNERVAHAAPSDTQAGGESMWRGMLSMVEVKVHTKAPNPSRIKDLRERCWNPRE